MEKIFYFNKNEIHTINGINPSSVLNSTLYLGERNIVENSSYSLQPICAGVLITKDMQVLSFVKANKAVSKNSPEKGRTLLYIGGHLDEHDKQDNTISSCRHGMLREVQEELGLTLTIDKVQSPIVIYTPYNEKASKHIGVIFPIFIEKTFKPNFSDGNCNFIKINDLNKIGNLDSWSLKIYSEILLKKQPRL